MAGGYYVEKSDLTLLNFGGAYPNQAFTVVIRGKLRNPFKTGLCYSSNTSYDTKLVVMVILFVQTVCKQTIVSDVFPILEV